MKALLLLSVWGIGAVQVERKASSEAVVAPDTNQILTRLCQSLVEQRMCREPQRAEDGSVRIDFACNVDGVTYDCSRPTCPKAVAK